MSRFTIDDLKRTMRECAGEDESLDLGGDIAEKPFDQLGFDSLAVMETTARVSREFGVTLVEDDLEHLTTPGALVAYVNERLPETV